MRMLKQLAIGLIVMMSTFVLVAGNANAAEPKPVEFVPAHISTMDCPPGNFCAWPGLNGTGSRCSWSNADNNWLAPPVVCSWAGSTRVQSYQNSGTSPNFTGVEIYLSPNYQNKFHCVLQGGQGWNVTEGGVFLRSHRWISGPCF